MKKRGKETEKAGEKRKTESNYEREKYKKDREKGIKNEEREKEKGNILSDEEEKTAAFFQEQKLSFHECNCCIDIIESSSEGYGWMRRKKEYREREETEEIGGHKLECV